MLTQASRISRLAETREMTAGRRPAGPRLLIRKSLVRDQPGEPTYTSSSYSYVELAFCLLCKLVVSGLMSVPVQKTHGSFDRSGSRCAYRCIMIGVRQPPACWIT